MNYAPFATPRTPKGYKYLPEPASPLARFGKPSPEGLPSLRLWKEVCRLNSESDNSMTSSLSSPSGSTGEMSMSTNESTSQGSLSELLQIARKRDSDVSPSISERVPKRVRRRLRQAIVKSGIAKGRKRKNSGTSSRRPSVL